MAPERRAGGLPRAAGPEPAPTTALTAPQLDVLSTLRSFEADASADEVARALGQHPNTVREHLDALRRAGQVERTTAAASGRGRGRPAYRYRALPGSGASGLHVGLVDALAEHLMRTSPDPVADAVAAGRFWSQTRAKGPDGGNRPRARPPAVRRHVVADLATLGFDPQADARDAVVRLRTCPVLESARRHPEVVCSIHAGLVEGLVERYGADAKTVSLTPFAGPGWCLLRLG